MLTLRCSPPTLDDNSMNNDEPFCVATYPSEIEAEIAKMKLGIEGIAAFIFKDDCGGMQPYLQTITGVRLMVRAKDFEAAERLLTHVNEDSPNPTGSDTQRA